MPSSNAAMGYNSGGRASSRAATWEKLQNLPDRHLSGGNLAAGARNGIRHFFTDDEFILDFVVEPRPKADQFRTRQKLGRLLEFLHRAHDEIS